MCNKKPDKDGKELAEDWTGKLLGADMTTEFTFKYTGKDFVCFEAGPTPPGPTPTPPDQPAKPSNTDTNIGQYCASTDDCTKNVTDADKKGDYCCGTATNGKLLDSAGKAVDSSTPANAIVCGKRTAVEIQAGYTTPDGYQYTIDYPASGFTCLSGAKHLIASAAVVLSAAAML